MTVNLIVYTSCGSHHMTPVSHLMYATLKDTFSRKILFNKDTFLSLLNTKSYLNKSFIFDQSKTECKVL